MRTAIKMGLLRGVLVFLTLVWVLVAMRVLHHFDDRVTDLQYHSWVHENTGPSGVLTP